MALSNMSDRTHSVCPPDTGGPASGRVQRAPRDAQRRPDASGVTDRTQDGQRLVESRELPELLNSNRTRPVWPTGRSPAFGPLWTNTRTPRHHDRTLHSDYSVFGHYYESEFGY